MHWMICSLVARIDAPDVSFTSAGVFGTTLPDNANATFVFRPCDASRVIRFTVAIEVTKAQSGFQTSYGPGPVLRPCS